MAISVNVRTSFSLLFPPILDEFGWDRGVTAAAFSVGFLASVVVAPLVGVLMDRFGPQIVIPLAAATAALGLVAATYTATPIGLYATLGLMVVGSSIAMSYHGHSMFLPNWFVRKRGLAIGLAFSGVGVGAIVVLPWIQSLIVADGWRRACYALAVLLVVVVIPPNLALQRQHPSDLGLEPDGAAAGDGAGGHDPGADPVVDRDWAGRHWTLWAACRTARFWWIFWGYFTALFAWYSVQVHQTKYFIETGFDPETAAAALGLVGLFGIAGQIGIGALSDRIGREWSWTVALLGYVVCYGALIALEASRSPALLYVAVAAQGALGYGFGSLYGVISNEVFAGPRFASIFSILGLGGILGGAAGPWLTGDIFDRTGSYLPAFWLCAVLAAVSIACIWLAAPRKVRLAAGVAARRARRSS